MNTPIQTLLPLVTLTLVSACQPVTVAPLVSDEAVSPTTDAAPEPDTEDAPEAAAGLTTADGTPIGTVGFVAIDDDTVRVVARLGNLEPGSTHGIHIHEGTTCTPPDFTSAGGHFAPDGHEHGERGPDSHHGDLGNVMANADGVALLEVELDQVSLKGEDSIVSRTVVLHAEKDDLTSQPSGDAGPRMACGTIE
jgi:Cu-Zn family superoxide dismutase